MLWPQKIPERGREVVRAGKSLQVFFGGGRVSRRRRKHGPRWPPSGKDRIKADGASVNDKTGKIGGYFRVRDVLFGGLGSQGMVLAVARAAAIMIGADVPG